MEIRISRGEKLFLDRRRSGHTQPQRAALLGIDYYEYRRLEQIGHHDDTPKDIVYNASIGDYCTIMRRRIGLSQQQVAEELETTRYLVNRMELDEAANSQLYDYIKGLVQVER